MYTDNEYYQNVEIGLTRLPVFIIGAYLGKRVYEKRELPGYVIWILLGLVILTFMILNANVLHSIYRRYFYAIGGVSLTLLIPKFLDMLKWNPINQLFSFFGKISLNLYLAHVMIIRVYKLTEFYDHKRLIHYIIVLIISVAVAYAAEKIIKCIRKHMKVA